MNRAVQDHAPSLERTSQVPSLSEVNAQIRVLGSMVKSIEDTQECCLAETTQLRKDKETLFRELELVKIESKVQVLEEQDAKRTVMRANAELQVEVERA